MATIATRKYNYSRQREVILRILGGTTCHPTAEWIFQRAKEELPQLSLGTVYRNLQILKQQGRIKEWTFGSSNSRYDATTDLHHHFICDGCGAMQDLFFQLPAELGDRCQAATPGMQVEEVRLEVHGRCADCAKSS